MLKNLFYRVWCMSEHGTIANVVLSDLDANVKVNNFVIFTRCKRIAQDVDVHGRFASTSMARRGVALVDIIIRNSKCFKHPAFLFYHSFAICNHATLIVLLIRCMHKNVILLWCHIHRFYVLYNRCIYTKEISIL